MTGAAADLQALYKGVLCAAFQVVRPGGRVVVLVMRPEMTLLVIRQTGRRGREGGEREGGSVLWVFYMRRRRRLNV
jgi:hypothetical protein